MVVVVPAFGIEEADRGVARRGRQQPADGPRRPGAAPPPPGAECEVPDACRVEPALRRALGDQDVIRRDGLAPDGANAAPERYCDCPR